MSFEGHYQILCTNGHSRGADCYDEPNFDGPEAEEYEGTVYQTPQWVCSCGAKAAWWNLVDTTNGSFCECPSGVYELENIYQQQESDRPSDCKYCENGRIDGHVELELDKEAVTQTCNLNHVHVIEEATYKIPQNKGHLTKWAKSGDKNEGLA